MNDHIAVWPKVTPQLHPAGATLTVKRSEMDGWEEKKYGQDAESYVLLDHKIDYICWIEVSFCTSSLRKSNEKAGGLVRLSYTYGRLHCCCRLHRSLPDKSHARKTGNK